MFCLPFPITWLILAPVRLEVSLRVNNYLGNSWHFQWVLRHAKFSVRFSWVLEQWEYPWPASKLTFYISSNELWPLGMTSFNLVSLLSYLWTSMITPFFFSVFNHKTMKHLLCKADPSTRFINSGPPALLPPIICSPMIPYFSLVSEIVLPWPHIPLIQLLHFPPLSASQKINLYLLFSFFNPFVLNSLPPGFSPATLSNLL